MKATLTILAALAFTAFAATVSHAQWYGPTYNAFGNSGYYRHASTAYEGYLRGWADLHRGVGQHKVLDSIAANYYQDAYSKAIDNDLKATEAYFTKRQINREARAAEALPKPTPQQLAQYARERAPERLSTTEYRPSVGKVYWPATLNDTLFAAERAEIDDAMAHRTMGDAGVGSESYVRINEAATSIQAKLKDNIRSMSPTEYLAAKKFVTRLAYEARFAPGVEGVAMR